MKVSTVSEMRGLDRTAIEEFGITEELLMENAGQAVYFVLLTESGIAGKRFLVFCGLGNNGGDGLVAARKIHSSGGSVKVFILGDPSRFKGPARLNFDIISRLPIQVQRLESSATMPIEGVLETDIADCDVIVDAILGTGITRTIAGLYQDVVQTINRSGKAVFSVDIPSGVHGDTGKVMGVAIRADHTVTFGLPKTGNLLLPGHDLGGELHVSHISFPPSMTESDALRAETNSPVSFPLTREDALKGDLSNGLFIPGAASHEGAAYLAALSFVKAGGGHARLAVPRASTSLFVSRGSEIVLVPQEETEAGSIALENKRALLELAQGMDIVVLAPGHSLELETQQLTRELTREIRRPLLIDGDRIIAVSQDPRIIQEREAETVILPHLSEMARIVKRDIGDIDSHKVEVLQQTSEELNSTIVLRDARLLIGCPNRRVFFNMSKDPCMATAGCGDVLVGTIAAMFGLGLSLGAAVRQGVFVYGLCGVFAAGGIAERQHAAGEEHPREERITAHDMLEYLPAAVRAIREGLDEPLMDRCAGVHIV